MPAITVDNLLTLPRLPALDPVATRYRDVHRLTTATHGYEGEGFPVRRRFAGVPVSELDPALNVGRLDNVRKFASAVGESLVGEPIDIWLMPASNPAPSTCGSPTGSRTCSPSNQLLLRLDTETACRRGGALSIHLHDLDPDRRLVQLREKGFTRRWQPITPALADCLVDHAAARGAVLPIDALLRFRNGRPITGRRYDHLWKRLGDDLPWVAVQGISSHWLRHTTLTWVERHFGYAVARADAGTTSGTAWVRLTA